MMKKVKKQFQKFNNNKVFLLLFLFVFVCSVCTFAQTDPSTGLTTSISNVTTKLTAVFKSVTTLLYIVAAICGIVGIIQVYNKWQSGDPNTTKIVASWFGAAIFVALAATILKTIFGIS
jgi:hypothetical protein